MTTVAAAAAGDVRAQSLLSDSARISLVTVMPGDAVYSLFGHSAIRVKDPIRQVDLSYSYGTFNFDDDMFVAKFAMGRLDYYLSVAYWEAAQRLYIDIEGRPAVEQLLDLTREERDDLFAFLRTNAREENKYYRYDFLFDNCSTRIRDALQDALGERVIFPSGDQDDLTFRQLLRPYLAETPFLELGIDLLLGSRTDRTASAPETTFLPDYLEKSFDQAVITDSSEARRPLVARKDSLITIEGYSRNRKAVDWPAIIFWTLAIVVLIRTMLDARKNRTVGMLDAVLYGLVGLVGCFLLFMWLGTAHHVTASNWNLAWAWPTHLVYAAVIARRGITQWTAAYAALTGASAVLLIALWTLVPQDLNETFLALVFMIAARSAWTAIFWRKTRAGKSDVLPAPAGVRS